MSQEIYFGYTNLSYILRKFRKIFLVHGNSFNNLDIREFFLDKDIISYNEFSPNPKIDEMKKGIELFNNQSCDVIVAVGGGSAIDIAKGIKLFSNNNHKSSIPLVAIPTTAGTGSESTSNAVIYVNGEKKSIRDESILPDYVFLIPENLNNLPTYQKKSALLDSYCQAIESWWSLNSNEESIDYSKKAVQLIMRNWKAYIENDQSTFSDIMLASNYSGRAINIAQTTLAHAMSYKITTLYGLAHGHAVAVCLKEVWPYLKNNENKSIDIRGIEYFRKIMNDIDNLSSYDWFLDFYHQLELPQPKTKNKDKDLNLLVHSVNYERLKNTPVQVNNLILKEMYERIIIDES